MARVMIIAIPHAAMGVRIGKIFRYTGRISPNAPVIFEEQMK